MNPWRNISMSLKEKIISRVGTDLAAIETALETNLTPYFSLVEKTARHILFAGGKRFRPLLMVFCARLCGSDNQNLYRFSTIFEYLHAATLLHDDLVDDAKFRRNTPVAHRVFGNETAVLTGDFLLARALTIAADTGLLNVISVISNITEQMSQGEIEQLHNKGRVDLTEQEYMNVIRRKTAVLIEGACQVGAMIAGATNEQTDQLKQYGYHLGMAFQMADDLLDYTAETDTLGKTVGADLKEGKLTLPVITALKNARTEDREWMLQLLQNKTFTTDDFNKFKKLLTIHGGISDATQKAQHYVETAKESLAVFSTSPEKELLEDIADYALVRRV